MSKLEPRKRRVNLPQERSAEPEPRQPLDVETIYRGVAASILCDPVSTPMDKLRALEAYMRVRPTHAPTIEQLTREETAGMSDAQLDELLGYLTRPIGLRDAREVEREIAAKTAKLEAEFEERIAARVRELVDVEKVEAQIERRARQIAQQGRPLTPVASEQSEQVESEPGAEEKVGGWPPRRKPRQPRRPA